MMVVASDGLAPARCSTLRALRLAATGAGLAEDDTPAAAKRKFAAAGEALREARSRQCARNGKRVRGTRGRGGQTVRGAGDAGPGRRGLAAGCETTSLEAASVRAEMRVRGGASHCSDCF
eukprot:SAG11_NODE_3990_length_2119_cov_39.338119_2_plen_120_part_00